MMEGRKGKIPPFSGNVKVKPNYHKSSVTVDGQFYLAKSYASKNESETETVSVKLITSKSDWEKLWKFCNENLDAFASQFWSNFIYPAIVQSESLKGARGALGKGKKEASHLVRWIKTDAQNLYRFLLWWMDIPLKKWPDYLKNLIRNLEKQGFQFYPDAPFKSENASNLTAICLQEVYGRTTEGILKPFYDESEEGANRGDSIYKFYCKPDSGLIAMDYLLREKTLEEVANLPFKDKTLKAVAGLVFQEPLSYIFDSLKELGLLNPSK